MRILLVEDERSMSRALAALLQKNNCSVDQAYDGEEALRYLRTGEYDAVLMDVMMPVMDGVTALRKMRSAGDLTPVIMLTAKSDIDDKVEGLDSGANDYVTKPCDSKELMARLRAVTRTVTQNPDNKLKYGNVTLDRNTCDMTGPSGSVKLPGKEFQMMEYLMSAPKTVISAERFMDRIWGIDSDADISVVWTFVSYLRRKIDSVGGNIMIRSSRGQGYYLEEKQDDT